MAVARSQLGQREVKGKGKSNPQILAYHGETRLKATEDEVHWCSAFVNWCLAQAGIVGTRSAAAISWATWGEPLEGPRVGCVGVMPRNDPKNPNAAHVGFVAAYTKDAVMLLAGNQGNMVSIKAFRRAGVKWHFRFPIGYAVAEK